MHRFVTKSDFDEIASKDKYYSNIERWHLYEAAVKAVREIEPSSVLELGAYRLPIVVDGDTMEFRPKLRPTILHDARVTPWPIARDYVVFVALQVWEHLGDRQRHAFRQVQRFAAHAVLSFPYRWNCPANPSHHGIDEERIREWTCGCKPRSVQVIASKTNHRRILYCFSFA